MIKVEIDGQTIEANRNEMIIAVADRAGIPIPRFCYHKKLSIAANCRMCLVEVEKAPKTLPACATPVAEGMRVFTASEKARDAQKTVMEFLLINHPLDCPICDQGGECELQDNSLMYGEDVSRYTQGKRSVKDKDIGPLISTDMTRCIHCTRCVRFGQEIAGLPELGVTGRGEHTEIGTFIEHSLSSEVSGNVIDLCPVGALTSKPYRFTARAWELQQSPAIAPHDCLGSHIAIHQRRDEVMRVVPRECESINETWMSDRDRYSYLGVKSADRLLEPRIKVNGLWKTVDWLTALKMAVSNLGQILDSLGPDQVAGIVHPNSTVEEMFLMQKWLRALKVKNIDHRLQLNETGAHASVVPQFEVTIAQLEKQNAVLLIGSNIRKEQPLAGLRLRKASLQGATISVLNSLDYDFHFAVQHKIITAPIDMLSHLASIAKAVAVKDTNLQAVIDKATVDAAHDSIAKSLQSAAASCLVLGPQALNHPQASLIKALATAIAQATDSKVAHLPEGGNVMGAYRAGILPDRLCGGVTIASPGLSLPDMFTKQLAAYILFNVEPEYDIAHANLALSALDNARFVLAITPFVTAQMELTADVMLPMAPFTETSGCFINIENTLQHFQAATTALGQSRPGWKILRVLANLCQLQGFDYESSTDILDEYQQTVANKSAPAVTASAATAATSTPPKNQNTATWPTKPADAHWRITTLAPYRCDNVVRRSEALQFVSGVEQAAIYISAATAQQLQVTDGDSLEVEQEDVAVRLPVIIDARVPANCVYTPAGFVQTNLAAPNGFVKLKAAKS